MSSSKSKSSRKRWNWEKQLASLEARLEMLENKDDDDMESEEETEEETLNSILSEVCNVIDKAQKSHHPQLDAIVMKADEVATRGVWAAYSNDYEIDFLKSFADMPDTLVKDSLKGFDGMGAQGPGLLMDFIKVFGSKPGFNMDAMMSEIKAMIPDPWSQTQQPHEQSTRLSRFRANITYPPSSSHPLASVVYQARCEVVEEPTCAPADMALSADGSCLALISCGGWKQRDPMLEYWSIGEETERQEVIQPPLSETARTLALDDTRKLMFVADSSRIKSFNWEDGTPMHTLRSSGHTGPLAVLPGGRVIRAGKGSALSWNIDELEIHGPEMKKIGKGRFDYEDSWRDLDDEDSVEPSTGSKPHATIPFAQKDFKPQQWHLHRQTGHMICGEDEDNGYHVVSLDLEHGGTTVARYIGHGGSLLGFSSSEEDANLFATACSDGYARLYDVRTPLPAVTFDVESSSGMVGDVVFTHIDGLPTLFTGGSTSQCVKLWDVRNKQCMYELSTGNNVVSALAWNAKNATLYAATECQYVDRMGSYHSDDYRKVKSTADDEDDYDERYWPTRATHDETSFGYVFDIGDHALFQYAFKHDANPDVIPAYGQARPSSGYW